MEGPKTIFKVDIGFPKFILFSYFTIAVDHPWQLPGTLENSLKITHFSNHLQATNGLRKSGFLSKSKEKVKLKLSP